MKVSNFFSYDELPFIFVAPAFIWQILFLYFPLLFLIINSFLDFRYAIPLTFSVYKAILNSLYFKVLVKSFFLALNTSIITLFLAYPVAYFIALKVRRHKSLFLFSLILPSWTSFIVQVYAWLFLLKKGGLFSYLFQKIGVLSHSAHLLNNYFAVQVGMAYCFLPFMIFPIYTILEKMDKTLIEASYDLGANKFQTFKRIIFPTSFSGVRTGFLLVFIPTFGEFAVPDLLGGGRKIYWGSVIVDKFLFARDWKEGAALTVVGILSLVFGLLLLMIVLHLVKKIFRTNV